MTCENLVSVSYSVMSSAYCLVTFHFLSSRGEAKRQKPKSHKAVGTRHYTVRN